MKNEEKLIITFLSRDIQRSDYDWANITFGTTRVGKARCLIQPDMLVIYSINIFPEFEGHGYGRAFVDEMKTKYDVIIADRVRHTAIGFWERLGFEPSEDGAYIFNSNKEK